MALDRESLDTYVDLMVKGQAADVKISPRACVADRPVEPCSLVIFGASGDLTTRKLAPSLYNLYLSEALPESFVILGAARSEMSHEQFQGMIKHALEGMDLTRWDEFASHLYYKQMDLRSIDSFHELSSTLEKLEGKHGTRANRIFYLAIPPSAYGSVAAMLGKAGLSGEAGDGSAWSRLVVEKPFGHDLKSAQELDRQLHEYFNEYQIFRIDHYLAKETVQNVLIFRFANAIFEPLWNRMFIDRVRITAVESLGVEKRAAYYEEAGVLRDMFQNHMMQLLAVTAMEPPAVFEAEPVRDEHVKVFRSLRPIERDDPSKNLLLGQYGPGVVEGKRVPGYREEPGVKPDSFTPTFGMLKVFIDNWRWQDVPFYLTSGKRLAKKLTEIVIYFKNVPHLLFQKVLDEDIIANFLTLGIQPEEKINLTFETKYPGAKVCLRSVTMDFNYQQNYEGPILDAYEKALIDCMQGDQMLFWRQDSVELCWAFLDPVLQHCADCDNLSRLLLPYEAGSWGPDAAQVRIART
ncbi:glucose-6-phosphate dehydrogenase [Desulfomonile tiedjei]|uniref:Glucose-6-phosphate 1-dehydrogenase n=1 Tax=Desulfomonile tiedjei (strain ATCC 49306 / DSM 6799 / DCB-1) TaxID=706587 RepID=I4C5A4_DESTA|nr:glucose-6-phosphate dehydrogenase [Desulfomonile tiedjei]AFM24745.1 glucose-6-phosphate 1-dehydrogenase [Desulfomonile tiedjei DSM 6799]